MDGGFGAGIACAHGKPLGTRYCTLKAPVPSAFTKSASAYTGLSARALHGHGAKKNVTTPTVTTTMLMDVKAHGDATRSTRVLDMVEGTALPHVRDTTGAFECGDKKNVTCLPATATGVSPGAHPFLLFARHGTFELYLGEPLMLVQTMTCKYISSLPLLEIPHHFGGLLLVDQTALTRWPRRGSGWRCRARAGA